MRYKQEKIWYKNFPDLFLYIFEVRQLPDQIFEPAPWQMPIFHEWQDPYCFLKAQEVFLLPDKIMQ